MQRSSEFDNFSCGCRSAGRPIVHSLKVGLPIVRKRVTNMITVYGEGRGFRVVWLLEEMGLPYRLRPVDLLAGVENDVEFLAINPAALSPQSRTAT